MKLPRFSLRTLLLLVAIIGVLLGCVVRQINWIRQRYEAAAKQEDLARRQATIDHFAVTRPTAPSLGGNFANKDVRYKLEVIHPFGSSQSVAPRNNHRKSFAVMSDAPGSTPTNDDVFKSNEPSR
jgi:hypothetical protein